MNTEVKNSIRLTDKDAQYDDKAKRLLGQKHILAHLLVHTVDEFAGMDPKDVVPYIEGEPLIGVVPVDPGMTNAELQEDGQRIVGFNQENAEINEGLIRFDIVFYVRMRDGLSQIIVNVEAQKDEPSRYDILNRAVFYVSRLIASQKERDFVHPNFNDIKRVFSIWICMDMEEDSMDYVHLTDDKLLGSHPWKGGLELLNIVLIGLAKNLPERSEDYELHRLLGALFSKTLSAEEKLSIMEEEYDIPIEDSIRKDVDVMCNLSQGIKEDGIEIGKEIGKELGKAELMREMYQSGITIEQIAMAIKKDPEEVRRMIEESTVFV